MKKPIQPRSKSGGSRLDRTESHLAARSEPVGDFTLSASTSDIKGSAGSVPIIASDAPPMKARRVLSWLELQNELLRDYKRRTCEQDRFERGW